MSEEIKERSSDMKKSLKIILIILLIILLAIITIFLLQNNKIIYSNTSYYDMGSITIRIYENGKVEEDREIEEPNHTPNFKKIKKLDKMEIIQLKSKIEEEKDEEALEKYIIWKQNYNFNT